MLKKILFILIAACAYAESMSQNTLYIGPGTAFTTTGGVLVILNNTSLINNGTLQQSPGDGLFVFNGNSDCTISGSSVSTFNILQVSKLTGKLTLESDVHIASQIFLTSGLLDLNAGNLYLETGALLMGETEISRIAGVGGYVQVSAVLNAPSSMNPGNLGATISSNQNLGLVTIRRGHRSQTNASGAGNSVLRYYDIMPANNSTLDATLRFNYFDAELNGLDEANLLLWKSYDNMHWKSMGFTTRNSSLNYVEKTGIADFSRWTLSGANNVLPLTFLLFNTHCDGDKVLLNWKTAQEENTAHFNIERSADGIQWTLLGSVIAVNNSAEHRYSFVDQSPSLMKNFYRIGAYDFDGNRTFTNIIPVACDSPDNLRLWPNPANSLVFITVVSKDPTAMIIKITDVKGAVLKIQKASLLRGTNQLTINMNQLPAGIYQFNFEWNGGASRKTVPLLKQ